MATTSAGQVDSTRDGSATSQELQQGPERLLTTAEVAEWLGVSKAWFMTGLIDIDERSRRLGIPKGTGYNWCYLRLIPFIKVGRVLHFDAEKVIQSLHHSARIAGRA